MWDVLETFATKYGDREGDFWYASVEDIFKYIDAVEALTVTESEIINESDIPLYIKINGRPTVIGAKTSITAV